MTIPETFRSYNVACIARSGHDIATCLARLTDTQILHRNADHENSIANLLLHLSGNMRQWLLHGIADQPDVRLRDEEFSLHPTLSVAEIRTRFTSTLVECRTIIDTLPDTRLLAIIDPQPGGGRPPMTILEVIMQVVGHLQLHTGQIILLTKQLTASDLDLSLPRKR